MLKTAFISAAVLLVAVSVTTFIALESGGVAIATTSSGHETRETHIWYVRHEGTLLLEAGHPDNPWVKDLVGGSSLLLDIEGDHSRYGYELHPKTSHHRIRQMMREKYGWRDWWVAFFFDTDESFLIEARRVDQNQDSAAKRP